MLAIEITELLLLPLSKDLERGPGGEVEHTIVNG
jgi:hypothetical protein